MRPALLRSMPVARLRKHRLDDGSYVKCAHPSGKRPRQAKKRRSISALLVAAPHMRVLKRPGEWGPHRERSRGDRRSLFSPWREQSAQHSAALGACAATRSPEALPV